MRRRRHSAIASIVVPLTAAVRAVTAPRRRPRQPRIVQQDEGGSPRHNEWADLDLLPVEEARRLLDASRRRGRRRHVLFTLLVVVWVTVLLLVVAASGLVI